jgi:8-oxo-dGTP pyrophosphatase MutT (NUDIX family)
VETKTYETGGGVVLNARGEVLLLERHVPREEGLRHEIRFPKGHIDPGETPEQAAVREVAEESGYEDLEVVAPLGHNDIEYDHDGFHVYRREHYFLMRLRKDQRSAPQFSSDEEALFQVRWAKDLAEAERLLTYEGEKLFARRASQAL